MHALRCGLQKTRVDLTDWLRTCYVTLRCTWYELSESIQICTIDSE